MRVRPRTAQPTWRSPELPTEHLMATLGSTMLPKASDRRGRAFREKIYRSDVPVSSTVVPVRPLAQVQLPRPPLQDPAGVSTARVRPRDPKRKVPGRPRARTPVI